MHFVSAQGRLLIAFVLSFVAIATATSAEANATVTYLRPNLDGPPSSKPWSVVGAPTAWDALDDSVSSSETPSASNYITASGGAFTSWVGLQTIPLAGAKIITTKAWVYSATSGVFGFEVFRASTGTQLAITAPNSPGWHSITLGALSQSQLDDLAFSFRSTTGPASKIYAAYLEISYTPSAPKVYWGARMDGEVGALERDSLGNPLPIRGDAPWTAETWNLFESHAGRPASIVHFGAKPRWVEPFQAAPLDLTKERGAIPLVSLGSEGATLVELEKGGAKEPAMKTWAQEVAAYGKPFFLRWDWEMNLKSSSKFPWVNEARANPASYVRAWRNIHDIADQQGATNITWVWCPNVSFPESTSLASLYPGNAYVDWTCMDGYNRGTKNGNAWTSFHNVFANTYAELTSLSFEGRLKPIMIGETASSESGGSKAEWIAEAIGTSLPNQFPAIKALVWFNWNITEEGTQWDWPIESPITTFAGPSASSASFANAIGSTYYASNAFENLPLLTRIQALP